MIKKFILLLALIIAASIMGEADAREKFRKPRLKMKCEKVGPRGFLMISIKRCENDEVICYYSGETGLQCKFKEEKDVQDF